MKATSITVDVKVSIPDDTITRCLWLLEKWMDDNPDKKVLVDRVFTETGYKHSIRVERAET